MISIPPSHPRYKSLMLRERIVEGYKRRLVVLEGLIAHGRGEAFDYLLGEETRGFALKAARAGVAAMLLARHPVISVNGNTAALAAEHVVRLAEATGAYIEVNLFYRSREREEAIAEELRRWGARIILGVGDDASATIPELQSERRRVSPRGILVADVVLVPLEDGDRTEALRRMGKTVVAVDLNPLSRTAQTASITIVDNIVRILPVMAKMAGEMKEWSRDRLSGILEAYDNSRILGEAIGFLEERLRGLAARGVFLELPKA